MEKYAVDGSLDSEIGVVRVALGRALRVLQDDAADPGVVSALVPLVYAGGRTVARLLRDRKLLSNDEQDTVMREMADALDDLASEWGVSL